MFLLSVKILLDLGVHEFMPGDTWISSSVGRIFCGLFPKVCGDIVGAIVSADKNLDNYDRYDVLSGHDPGLSLNNYYLAGTSVKNLIMFK